MHNPWSRDICPICVSLASTLVLTVLSLSFFAGSGYDYDVFYPADEAAGDF